MDILDVSAHSLFRRPQRNSSTLKKITKSYILFVLIKCFANSKNFFMRLPSVPILFPTYYIPHDLVSMQ